MSELKELWISLAHTSNMVDLWGERPERANAEEYATGAEGEMIDDIPIVGSINKSAFSFLRPDIVLPRPGEYREVQAIPSPPVALTARDEAGGDKAQLVGVKECASRVGVPAKWLRMKALAGDIPCLNTGRKLLFNAPYVEMVLLGMAGNKHVPVRPEEQP